MRLIIEGTMAEISNVLSALREKELLPSETCIEKQPKYQYGSDPVFQDNIRRLREQAGLTQLQLADKCGVSKQLIDFLETGRRQPTTRILIRLSAVFECTVDDLFSQKYLDN